MGRPPFTDEQIEAQRDSVIRAAEGLFAELGYDGVTLRAIAKMTGQSAAAPYRYFENKAAIFNAARVAAYHRFAAAQAEAAARAANPADRLTRLGDAYVQFAIDEPDAYRLMFELKPSEAARAPEVEEGGAMAWQPLRDAIGEAVEAGAISGDPDVLAHLFWAGLHGITSLHLADKFRHGLDLLALRDPMKTLLFSGSQDPSNS
ncbi:MAG: TetR/AcrR family transcriptional regulator [Myxococcota bacterium]|jgi:AcrR family transcriptional regulator|nr:TetR/AcrR family transcriptional regulator [Myxococcota bacterium]